MFPLIERVCLSACAAFIVADKPEQWNERSLAYIGWATQSIGSFFSKTAVVIPYVLASALLLGFLIPDNSVAQQREREPEPALSTAESAELDNSSTVYVAPVVVDGETLFSVRGSTALPADERAEKIAKRILDLATLPAEEPVKFSVESHVFGRAVLANGKMVTVTTKADAELEKMDIDVLAALHAEAIQAVIDKYKEDRTDDARVESTLFAVGWTIAFVLATLVLFKGRRKLISSVETFSAKRFSQVEKATNSVVQGEAIAQLIGFLTNVLLWIIYLFIFYYYLSLVLLAFAETRPIAEILLTYVSDPLLSVLFSFLGYFPNLIMLAIIAIVARYLIKGANIFAKNMEAGTFEIKNFEPHWITPTFNLVRILIIAIAIVFAYPYIPGSDSRAFQGLTILAGLMVSIGSNSVVNNMMAGLFVLYRRSTNIGDRIEIGGKVGDVIEIKLMETLIKSVKNEMISIPNAQLLNSEVINYSRKIDGQGLLLHTTVGIGYEEPQEKIEAMLIEAANRTPGLKKSPEPFVLWTKLADFAINYQINAYTTRGSSMPKLLSDLHRNIVTVFNENKVQIMTPSYERDPDVPKIATETWNGQLASRQ